MTTLLVDQTVRSLDLDEIQRRLRSGEKKEASVRREQSQRESESKELDDIFDAVENDNEDFIQGLLVREFGRAVFRDLSDLEFCLNDFFSGGRELSMVIDLNNPIEQTQGVEMKIIFRPRIGETSFFVEIKLANFSGLGKRGGKTITRITDAKILAPERPNSPPDKKAGAGWLGKLFGKK